MVISSRNRNLGYGWTNDVVQDGDHLRIAHENIPCMAQGGIATVLRERDDARRINSGNDWAEALFVGGKRITAWYGACIVDERTVQVRSRDEYDALVEQAHRDCDSITYLPDDVFDDEGEATVHVWRHGDGWRSPNVRDILLGLSEGAEVRVALSE